MKRTVIAVVFLLAACTQPPSVPTPWTAGNNTYSLDSRANTTGAVNPGLCSNISNFREGDVCYNTTVNNLRVYNGTGLEVVG